MLIFKIKDHIDFLNQIYQSIIKFIKRHSSMIRKSSKTKKQNNR